MNPRLPNVIGINLTVSQPSFTELFQKYIDQTCTPAEVDQLFEMLENGEDALAGKEMLKTHFQDGLEPTGYTDDDLRQRLENRFKNIEQHIALQQPRVKRVNLVWRWVAAAAVIVLVGSSIWYWFIAETKPAVVLKPQQQSDILPGSNKAVLTLADGKTIALDSAAHQLLSQQGQTTVNQQGGELIYESATTAKAPAGELIYNTLTTPRGGQYQLTLPEGTQVWLNSASSIRFPATFNDSARVVYVTGEAYFEVKPRYKKKKNERVPFIVEIQSANGLKQEVEVLGTHFNINAYEDEPYVTTTLLEGKVSVNRPGIASPAFLLPGQQAQLNPQSKQVRVIKNADIVQAMAWKNGLFRFDGVELKTVMRQLARWYDVEIIFDRNAPVSEPFNGAMQRSLQLSQVIKGMSAMGIHVKKEGKNLIVMP
jgi:ferric-dicitrate binding protein FerR (iron transport regulator)